MGGYMQVVGSLLDTYLTQKNAQRNMEYQNDYNDPASQVARLRGAGLTPWSVNANGNLSAQPVLGQSNIAGALGTAEQNRIAARQVDVQENLAVAQKLKEESQAKVNDTLARTNEVLLRYLPESERQRIRSMSSGSDYTEKQTARYDETIDQQLKLQKSQETLNYSNSDAAKASTKRINTMLTWEVKEAQSRIAFNTQQIATLKTQANLNDKQCANLGVLTSKYRSEIQKLGAETWALRHSNEIWKKCGVKPGTPAWTAVVDVLGSVLNQFGPE